jgi:Flp pilus assembly pilin Flp
MKRLAKEHRGAVAVEFALLLPILIALLLGIMEFGLAYSTQVTITNAAREAARTMAIHKNESTAKAAALTSAPHLNPELREAHIRFSAATCVAGSNNTTTIDYPMRFVTGFFGTGITITGRATMRCGG